MCKMHIYVGGEMGPCSLFVNECKTEFENKCDGVEGVCALLTQTITLRPLCVCVCQCVCMYMCMYM